VLFKVLIIALLSLYHSYLYYCQSHILDHFRGAFFSFRCFGLSKYLGSIPDNKQQDIFLISKSSKVAVELTWIPIMGAGFFFQGRQNGRMVKLNSLYNADFKNASISICMVWCLVKHRDDICFYLYGFHY
jgi:hypothetical protein